MNPSEEVLFEEVKNMIALAEAKNMAFIGALVAALHHENILPRERFIATLRRHALQGKASGMAGSEDFFDDLLAVASNYARDPQQQYPKQDI